MMLSKRGKLHRRRRRQQDDLHDVKANDQQGWIHFDNFADAIRNGTPAERRHRRRPSQRRADPPGEHRHPRRAIARFRSRERADRRRCGSQPTVVAHVSPERTLGRASRGLSRHGRLEAEPARALPLSRFCFRLSRLLLPLNPTELPTVEFVEQPGKIVDSVGGEPVATYVYDDPKITRPYFAHVHAPGGMQVTRHHPPIAGQDHDGPPEFHPGIWMAFGDI